jgi:hypothetical protein
MGNCIMKSDSIELKSPIITFIVKNCKSSCMKEEKEPEMQEPPKIQVEVEQKQESHNTNINDINIQVTNTPRISTRSLNNTPIPNSNVSTPEIYNRPLERIREQLSTEFQKKGTIIDDTI